MAVTKTIPGWRKGLAKHFSIARKIGYGYGVAISIATLGTAIGLIVGDHSQQQAQEQLQIAESQDQILDELATLSMSLQSHPQRLLTVLQDSIWFRYETSKFRNDFDRANELLSELESFTQDNATQTALDPQLLQELIQNHTTTTDAYNQFITGLWQRVDPQKLRAEQIAQSPQQVLAALTDEEAIQIRLQFEHLSESLIQMQQAAAKQKMQAYEQLNQANAFRLNTIILSIALSTAIAIALAIITSRAIARPVQTLTDVAQQSIREANFDLQAPVTSNDEIGSLAHAFNQLIAFVKQLLQQQQDANEQLELYSQTLEQKVEQRTQELKEKNTHLKQLLEELHRTQTQMVQSEKMSSLGQLVAGVAHEINNPVNFIHGNLEHINNYAQDLFKLVQVYEQQTPQPSPMLQETLDEIDLEFLTEDLQKILQSMRVGTNRIREIVLSLRNFSRLDEAEFKAVDLHEGIDNTLLILQHRLKAKAERPEIQIIKEYEKLPLAECYPGQLNQVFMNLLANAIDALEESNRERSFQEIAANPNVILIQTQQINENLVSITIADNGSGIPDAARLRLFDPFFTTKPVGQGTGLGLSISYQIVVEKHKGRMYCDSTPGKGTKFVIEIPVQHAKSSAS